VVNGGPRDDGDCRGDQAGQQDPAKPVSTAIRPAAAAELHEVTGI
jgi:hypothetical protein